MTGLRPTFANDSGETGYLPRIGMPSMERRDQVKPFLQFSLALAVFANMAHAEITQWKVVGEWDVSFYSNADGCLAYAEYEGGMSFFIGLTDLSTSALLEVSLLKDQWQGIEAGKEYSIKVQFGNEEPWTLEMLGVKLETLNGLTFTFDASSDQAALFAEEFMREVSMDWSYAGQTVDYVTLRGSRAAFEEAVACAKSYRDAITPSDDPFSSGGQRSSDDPFAN